MSRPFWTYGPDKGARNPMVIGASDEPRPASRRPAVRRRVTTSTTLHHGGHRGKAVKDLSSVSPVSSVVERLTAIEFLIPLLANVVEDSTGLPGRPGWSQCRPCRG